MNGNFYKIVSGFLLTLLLSVGAYFVREKDRSVEMLHRRIDKLEQWREAHEKYSRERSEVIESRLVRIEEKLDALKSKR